MNNRQPMDMTFQFEEGGKTLTLGEMYTAHQQMAYAQADLDTLRNKLVDTHEALTIVCGLVLDTVGQIAPEIRTEKENQLIKILDQMGFKAIL